jgi:hypothetical protein
MKNKKRKWNNYSKVAAQISLATITYLINCAIYPILKIVLRRSPKMHKYTIELLYRKAPALVL